VIIAKHKVQACSFGGCGTTLLYNFFRKIKVDISSEPDAGRWKHMPYPPATPGNPDFKLRDDYKAVYIFGNPMNALASLFKRKHHVYHPVRTGFGPKKLDNKMKLEDYLKTNKEDIFKLEFHFDNWTTCPKEGRAYPILLLKYETLWNNLPALLEFLDIPQEKRPLFPKKKARSSNWTTLPEEIKNSLYERYGTLAEKIEKQPEFKII